MESKYNIADWLTRGKKLNEINLNSIWQNGPRFLELPESEWPIHKYHGRGYVTIERAVNKLVVLIPKEEAE